MLVLNVFVIFLIQLSLLLQEADARVRHIDEFAGTSKNEACDCGIPYFKPHRIIGDNTEVSHWHEFPWMVAIYHGGKTKCGGTLIDTQYVLTAAHCINNLVNYDRSITWVKKLIQKPEMREISVILNMHRTDERKLMIGISGYSFHPTYDINFDKPVNDIAIIKLERPVFYSERLRPICLSVDPKMSRVGIKARVAGWGKTSRVSHSSNVLRKLDLKIRKNSVCRQKLNATILETAICAGGKRGYDACQGDSGGPLFFTDSNYRSYQIGIISWGESCAKKGLPGVYTRINTFIHWIRNTTSDSPSCEMMLPPLMVPNAADCGIPEEKCFVNGTSCHSGKYMLTWMAKFFYNDKLIGTGVLVNRSYVLTSSSVIPPWHQLKSSRKLKVVLGMRREEFSHFDFGELVSGVAYVSHYILSIPVVIVKLDIETKDLTLLHRPLCMPDPMTIRRPGEKVSLIFWKQNKVKRKKNKSKKSKSKKKNKNKKKVAQAWFNWFKYTNKRKPKSRKRFAKTSLVHQVVEIVNIKRCKVPKVLRQRYICGVVKGKNTCHENGATLLKYVAGRFFMLGIVSSESKRCSRAKLFLDMSWHVKWIRTTMVNLRTVDSD